VRLEGVSGVAGAVPSHAVKSPIRAGTSAGDGKGMMPGVGQDEAALVGIMSGEFWFGAVQDQRVQVTYGRFQCSPV